MKLPGFQAGAVQPLRGVDPGVYKELGRAQAEFGAAISQGGEAMADIPNFTNTTPVVQTSTLHEV